ncbi:MAG: CoA transferase [Gammaproteobacteria bacterium]|nr:CoA transferase [Gammaproteobacteria bacterium]MDH5303307.1 CoA transferase [Gammaproteobacteria bacterium]MDH5321610.1 CoA transferase [Gammaproteobacteria bacterium]
MNRHSGTGPLGHVRVLDLSRIMAGPWASQILADLGADVIKIERPGAGDDTRSWGPPFLQDTAGNETRDSGYYLCVNRGKRSVTLDISRPEGQAVVRRLARECDIVLENYKVGTLARYGLAFEDLQRENPALIYASVTGFGQDGPRKSQAAYDFMIQAMGGLMSITGEADDKPGGGPQKVGLPIVDLMTGMYATVAVLAALARRAETGKGDYIDLAMLDVQLGFLANQSMNFLLTGRSPKRHGNSHPNIQPQNVYACRDGKIAVAVGNDDQFAKFVEQLGCAEMADDARFKRNSDRVHNLAALNAMITDALACDDMAAWVGRMENVGVPCSPINSIPDVLQEPQLKHRGMLRELDHPLAGKVPQIVSPMRFRNAPLQFERAPPVLGQHTDEVLQQLGLDTAAVQELRDKNVI